ncbi:MAG: hypothetical protein Q9M92_08925 [Enterobacterales bacterium]|nr:hypothetical protein [Enterobacterales bacterium]
MDESDDELDNNSSYTFEPPLFYTTTKQREQMEIAMASAKAIQKKSKL